MIILIRVEAQHPTLPILSSVYFTSGTHYTALGVEALPTLKTGLLLGQQLFSSNLLTGSVTVDVGKIVIDNVSGGLDYLEDYIFDGQSAELYLLEDESSPLPADPDFVYRITNAEFSLETVTIHISSARMDLQVPMQPESFTSEIVSDPLTDFEGSGDVRGSKKPILIGLCYGVPVACLNSFHLIYASNYDRNGNRGAITAVYGVFDKGGKLTFSANYSDLTALIAAVVPGGHYATCLDEGLIKLGTSPKGLVTADLENRKYSVFEEALNLLGWTPDVEYDATEAEAVVPTHARYQSGYFVREDETVLDVVTHDLNSLSAWGSPDQSGKLRFGRLKLHTELSAQSFYFSEDTIKKSTLKKLVPPVPQGIPVRRINVSYNRVWGAEDASSLLESLSPSEAIFRSNSHQVAGIIDDSNIHPLGGEFDIAVTSAIRPRFWINDPTFFAREAYWDHTGGPTFPSDGGSVTLGPGDAVRYYLQSSGFYGDEFFVTVVCEFDDPGETGIFQWTMNSTESADLVDGVNGFDIFFDMDVDPPGEPYITITNLSGNLGSLVISSVTSHPSPYQENFASVSRFWQERLNLFSKPQSRYEFKTTYNLGKDYQPGDEIGLALPRYGLDTGKTFQVLSKTTDWNKNEISFEVWRVEAHNLVIQGAGVQSPQTVGNLVATNFGIVGGYDPFTLTTSVLPTGATARIVGRTLLLEGTFSAAGVFNINIVVTDAAGQTASYTDTVTVNP